MIPSRSFLVSVLLWIVFPAVCLACSVPVFRYAIEHWNPDGYVVRVFYKGELSAEQNQWLNQLRGSDASESKPNINLLLVNIDQPLEGESAEVWKSHPSDALPSMVVQMPASAPSRAIPIWQGELSATSVQQLIRSPMRSEIEKRLLDGDSVVWVQLDSGESEKDKLAFEVLKKELERLEKEIELPKIEEADLTSLSVAPAELKIRFSALRLAANDLHENILREMLLSVEADLRDESVRNLTMSFPVFGRGRALYALTGEGINASTIEDACRFLTGACQCTVKAENPGVDLLLSANWSSLVTVSQPKEVDVDLVGLGVASSVPNQPNQVENDKAPTDAQHPATSELALAASTKMLEPPTTTAKQKMSVIDELEHGDTQRVGLLALGLGTIGVAAVFLVGLLLLARRPQ